MHYLKEAVTFMDTGRFNLFIAEKPLIDIWLYKAYVKKVAFNPNDVLSDCPFAVTDWSLLTTSIAFAYSKKFTYTFLFDKALQRLVEAGLINFWFRNMLPRAQICPLNPKVNERRLRNSDLQLTYYIVAVGFAIAALFFCAELVNNIIKKRRHTSIVTIPQNMLFTKSPPPPYSSLFGPPFPKEHNYKVKRKEINGRDYWCVTSVNSKTTKLIPVRAPSAVLFNYTKY
ncbi:uncharacterized protein LOC112904296 [Agrilus planipennis]|uniref:Uncharacterized protein LOC112904296 n=1 Tax=Agrilus planipennis TaxID=224129 RepID=A0A7F5QX36_AGRPL|nr:uncharacterized protein LOC112904296 [Agrilus planipennis]